MPQPKNYVEQVGGTHYGNRYGHWDYCKDAQTPYLEGHATKYIYRWQKKGGVEDLEKALSFIDKIMVGNEETFHDRDVFQYNGLLEQFFHENDVPAFERMLIYQIINWQSYQDLLEARYHLVDYIRREVEHQQAVQAKLPETTTLKG